MARRSIRSPLHGVQKREQSRKGQTSSAPHSTESQQMLALAPLFKKGKADDKEIEKFEAKAAADQKALSAQVEQRFHHAKEQDRRRKNELASAFLDALQTPNRPAQRSPPGMGESKIAQNAIYTSVADMLHSSGALLRLYDNLETAMVEIQDEVPADRAEVWNKDIAETNENFEKGARTALRAVKKVLGAEVQDESDNVGDGGDVEEIDDGELSYELQKGLKYTERGVKRMVKGLDKEDF